MNALVEGENNSSFDGAAMDPNTIFGYQVVNYWIQRLWMTGSKLSRSD
jgi:hypothetical protein